MDIPQLPWFKVLLFGARHFSKDMYSMAETCKVFQEMLNDPKVWRTVSIEKYPWHEDWYGFHEGKSAKNITIQKSHTEKFFMTSAGMARHKESCYNVGLLGLLNPSKGKEGAMEFLCHLSKMKKIGMQVCRDSIIYRLLKYSLGMVTLPTLAKYAADNSYFEGDCVQCEGNNERFLAFDRCDGFNLDTLNYGEACKWKRELPLFETVWV